MRINCVHVSVVLFVGVKFYDRQTFYVLPVFVMWLSMGFFSFVLFIVYFVDY